MKKMGILFLIILPLYVFPQHQSYRFESITSKDGLSHNSVVTIFQDKRHFLWFGTFDGLNRYDGYNLKVYRADPKNPYSISGSIINSISEDQNDILWLGSQDGGLSAYNRETDRFKKYYYDSNNPHSLSNNKVKVTYVDHSGNVWVGTEYGLNKYDRKLDQFTQYYSNPRDENSLTNSYINSICEDSKGNLWIGTWNGLNKFDPINNKFTRYINNPHNRYGLISGYVSKVYIDKRNNLWVGTNYGLYKLDDGKKGFIKYLPDENNTSSLSDPYITDILEDTRGNLWIATSGGGLNILNREKGSFVHYRHDGFDNTSLSNDVLLKIFEDECGVLWFGTNGGGVNKLDVRKSQFQNFISYINNKNNRSHSKVHSIYEDKAGNIWTGIYGGGLNKYNPKNNSFTKFVHNSKNTNSIIDNKIRCFIEDHSGMFWIGTDNGLDKYDIRKNKFTHYSLDASSEFKGREVFSICETSSREIWVGTYEGGLFLYNPKTDKFSCFQPDIKNPKSISSNIIRNIFQDKYGIIWIGTDLGLERFDRKKMEFVNFRNDPKNPSSISCNMVMKIMEDNKGSLWIATANGLNKLVGNRQFKDEIKFIHYTKKDGLPANSTQAVIADNDNNIWISTSNGLSKLNPTSNTFTNFTMEDGLPDNGFCANACYKREKTGELLFGSENGIIMFNPRNIKDDPFIPSVTITSLRISHEFVETNQEVNGVVVIDKPISEASQINVSYKNSAISFEFSTLLFSAPKSINFAYMMEGLDTSWSYVGNKPYVIYTYLPPGEYIFCVKATNSSGIWSDKVTKVKIVFIPPYWQTLWFKTITGCLILTLGFLIYKARIKSIEKRNTQIEAFNKLLLTENRERRHAETEMRKAKENAENSEKLKTEFLAQMSHEIRTPINSILSFTSLLKHEISDKIPEELAQSFPIIDRAGNRLIRTIDLILNMSQLQTNTYECNYKYFDIYQKVLKDLIKQHQKAAEDKGISLIITKNTDDTKIYADEYTVGQILENLINNAIKYTQRGKVEVIIQSVDKNRLKVEVVDTGIGIKEEFLPNLFKPFTQEEGGYTRQFEGNGLGLALVKKYCEINNAEITVESKKEIGTKFSTIFQKNDFSNATSI